MLVFTSSVLKKKQVQLTCKNRANTNGSTVVCFHLTLFGDLCDMFASKLVPFLVEWVFVLTQKVMKTNVC